MFEQDLCVFSARSCAPVLTPAWHQILQVERFGGRLMSCFLTPTITLVKGQGCACTVCNAYFHTHVAQPYCSVIMPFAARISEENPSQGKGGMAPLAPEILTASDSLQLK